MRVRLPYSASALLAATLRWWWPAVPSPTPALSTSIEAIGTGYGAFHFTGGWASGNPLYLVNAGLNIGPQASGAANFLIEGNSTLCGDVAAAQTLVVQANQPGGDTATLTAANGFTNAGIITLQC